VFVKQPALKRSTIYIALFLASVIFLCSRIFELEHERRVMKEDLIELSKIKYGLFNVDEWKKILAGIISKKIGEFDFDETNREQMRKSISELLYKIIGDFEDRYQKNSSRSFKGFVRGQMASFLGIFSNVRKDIPKFTEQILDFMNDPRNRKAVQEYMIGKLNEYTDKTFSKMDYSSHDEIISRNGFEDRPSALAGLTTGIDDLEKKSRPYKVALFAVAILIAIYIFAAKLLSRLQYLFLILISFILLLTGLVLPMIEIDARISSMTFTLLGESVAFKDQVLYYKSKSILEVVQLMITQHRIDVLLVGILVFIFSVLFPVSKLLASILYIYSGRTRENAMMRFLIFQTGKWSMADVMVIAIFMSYIGFSGIISEQLEQIEAIAGNIDILTTNRSSLLSGFFCFTSFALLSLLISHKLQFEFRKVT
jgi:hypothetical protein